MSSVAHVRALFGDAAAPVRCKGSAGAQDVPYGGELGRAEPQELSGRRSEGGARTLGAARLSTATASERSSRSASMDEQPNLCSRVSAIILVRGHHLVAQPRAHGFILLCRWGARALVSCFPPLLCFPSRSPGHRRHSVCNMAFIDSTFGAALIGLIVGAW